MVAAANSSYTFCPKFFASFFEEVMVERKIELRRRRSRGAKLAKYKSKLASAKDGKEREDILKKIHRISPWWKE